MVCLHSRASKRDCDTPWVGQSLSDPYGLREGDESKCFLSSVTHFRILSTNLLLLCYPTTTRPSKKNLFIQAMDRPDLSE